MATGITVRCAIPRIHDGQLQWLLVERKPDEDYFPGFMEFPGGGVKRINGKLESLDETIERELQEEIGVKPENLWLIDKNVGARGDNTLSDTWQVLFSADSLSGEPIANLSQIAAVRWVTHEDMRNTKLTRLTKHWFYTLPYFREQTGVLIS